LIKKWSKKEHFISRLVKTLKKFSKVKKFWFILALVHRHNC
jgi:hypothetical protein